MSRLFGEMRQVGIVVRDIESAMRHWVEVCGVGPWFYADRLAVTSFTYAGPSLRRCAHLHCLGQLGGRAARADPAALRHAEHVSRLPRRWA